MKARYLFTFSYIGTYFRGAEKIWLKASSTHVDPQSIQGVMEIALQRLRSLNYPKVSLSSRTDSGVHALNATAHVDLERFGSSVYNPEYIAQSMNKYFDRHSIGVLVHRIQRVPDGFDARRNALSRTYMYRFATLKKSVVLPETIAPYAIYPVEEWKRCYFIRDPKFDIEKFKEGASHLPGYHDWSSFKKVDKLKVYKHNRRLLYSVDVRPGQPLVTAPSRGLREDLFDYWEAEFHGRAYVHNQIRRIVGLLQAVAQDRVPADEVKVMLQVPSKHSWPTKAVTAPPHGLYLCNVEYDPKDLEFTESTSSEGVPDEELSDDD